MKKPQNEVELRYRERMASLLRPYRSSDRPAVLELLAQLPELYPQGLEWLQGRLEESDGISIALEENAVVGIIIIASKEKAMKISTLFVAEEHRRRGLGQKLLARGIAGFLESDLNSLYITLDQGVRSQLWGLLDMYGFEITSRISNRYRANSVELVCSVSRRGLLTAISHHNHRVYETLADEYEQRVESLRGVTATGVKDMLRFLPAGAKILDVGCGTGLSTRLLLDAGCRVTAVEYSEKMVEYARARNPEAQIIHDDYLTVKLEDDFHGIIALAFIHLFPRQQAHTVLRRMFSQLRPGGVLYTGTTAHPNSSEGLVRKSDYATKLARWRREWTQEELEDSFGSVGFEILEAFPHSDPYGKRWLDYALRRPL